LDGEIPMMGNENTDAAMSGRGRYADARIPCLMIKALYYRMKASGKLPGRKFDSFGRRTSFLFLRKGRRDIFLRLLCNPVSIVRYFEFSFAADSVPWPSVRKCLDVSSPRLLFLYLLHRFPGLHFDILNPDRDDIRETGEYLDVLKLRDRSEVFPVDVMNAPIPEDSYDVVTTLSVLEHIPDEEDERVLRKLWGFLKAKGRLVITVPCSQAYCEEWRNVDAYGLGSPMRNGKYFFQRIYDMAKIRERIIDVLGTEPVTMKVFGEKAQGIYAEYERNWIAFGLWETVKDPYHIVSDYRNFSGVEELEGVGVCGLMFEKGA
jgi:predicted SAM-dependent methyltransferase